MPVLSDVFPEGTHDPRVLYPCRHGDCERTEYARGWCPQHWGRLRDGRPLDDPPRRADGICAHDGCDIRTATLSCPYCRKHRYRDLRGRAMDDAAYEPVQRPDPPICGPCKLFPWARGLCAKHYTAEWKAGKLTSEDGEPLGGPPPPAECTNCRQIKKIKSRGLCSRCHNAATRAGTLDEVAAPTQRQRRDDTAVVA